MYNGSPGKKEKKKKGNRSKKEDNYPHFVSLMTAKKEHKKQGRISNKLREGEIFSGWP